MQHSLILLLILSTTAFGQESRVLLDDNFNREESSPEKEEIGNGWSTNSRTRAKGQKQVDLADGAMHITRAEVADHGVSVVHDVDFRDATISLRFQLGPKDDLGINIADMKEKSVHAGHICVARVRGNGVEISDLKTGNMKLEHRNARKAGNVPQEMTDLLKTKKKVFPHKLKLNEWHQLIVRIAGDTMTVTIDEKQIGQFSSEGIAHPTKSRLRLSVNRSAWVDDVKITTP
ncbi:MAG: DUF1080 domain-containing protein [Planctomycetaceae bacterium]|nr:DUF1080 domain-containing protein [Planctomycetaceae bacterium]